MVQRLGNGKMTEEELGLASPVAGWMCTRKIFHRTYEDAISSSKTHKKALNRDKRLAQYMDIFGRNQSKGGRAIRDFLRYEIINNGFHIIHETDLDVKYHD